MIRAFKRLSILRKERSFSLYFYLIVCLNSLNTWGLFIPPNGINLQTPSYLKVNTVMQVIKRTLFIEYYVHIDYMAKKRTEKKPFVYLSIIFLLQTSLEKLLFSTRALRLISYLFQSNFST